jgi:hypothetical protein
MNRILNHLLFPQDGKSLVKITADTIIRRSASARWRRGVRALVWQVLSPYGFSNFRGLYGDGNSPGANGKKGTRIKVLSSILPVKKLFFQKQQFAIDTLSSLPYNSMSVRWRERSAGK